MYDCDWNKQKEEEFVFSDISERPVPSLLRGYSSPIRLESDLTDSDLSFLLAHDSDEFNRFVFLNAAIPFFFFFFFFFVIEQLMDRNLIDYFSVQLGGWTAAGTQADAQLGGWFPTKQAIGSESKFCAWAQKHTRWLKLG